MAMAGSAELRLFLSFKDPIWPNKSLLRFLIFFAFSPQILHFYNSSLFLIPNMFHYNEFNHAVSCWWNFGSEFGQCSISYDIIEEFWSVIVRFVGVNYCCVKVSKERNLKKKLSPFWSEIFHKGYYLLLAERVQWITVLYSPFTMVWLIHVRK